MSAADPTCDRAALASWLDAAGACKGPGDALPWLASLPAGTTPEQAWEQCERSDWMMWLVRRLWSRLSTERQEQLRPLLVLTACACARTSLRYLTPEDRKVIRGVLQTTERWAREGGDLTKVRAARERAWKIYAADAAADAAAAATTAATTAATATATAAAATADAAADAGVADAAADAAAADATRSKARARQAVIVRRHLPAPLIAALLREVSL